MNKVYVSPLAVEVTVEVENMLATSFEKFEDIEVGSDEQLSSGNRGWGNLWKK